jgi:tRNA(fMet)-specific endonuclease VapC
MKTLLDTDIFSEILKAKHPQVRQRAEQYLSEQGSFTISVITVLEVVSALRRSGTPERLAAFLERLESVEVLECDRAAAEISGNIYADLTRNGRPIGLADTIIAGIALRHELPLATGNRAHFGFIRDAGYPLETVDWRLLPG